MQDPNYNKSVPIKKSYCDLRATMVSNVAYKVSLNLPRGEHYSGFVLIEFDYACLDHQNEPNELYLDF